MAYIKDILLVAVIGCLLFGVWWLWSDNSDLSEENASLKRENETCKLQIQAEKLNVETLEKKIEEQNRKIDLFYEENREYQENICKLNESNRQEAEKIEERYRNSSPSVNGNPTNEEFNRWLRERASEY